LEIVIISLVVFAGSILTFFSGFGLGTLLLPVFSLFFPLEIAIFATAIVHFFNSLFKVIFVVKRINYLLLIQFAPTAILFAFFGAWFLSFIDSFNDQLTYEFSIFHTGVTPVKMTIGIIMISFAIIEFFYKKQSFEPTRNRLIIGGALSGFFGGLSGHQGAFRSMFLSKANVTKEEFIATSSAIGFLIDLSRLIMYSFTFSFLTSQKLSIQPVLLISIAVAFIGSYFGSKLLAKTTIGFIQKMVAILLFVVGTLICLGFI